MDLVVDRAARIIAAGGTTVERMRSLGRDLVALVAEHPDHVSVCRYELRDVDRTMKRFCVRRREYDEVITKTPQHGVDEGLFDAAQIAHERAEMVPGGIEPRRR